MSSPGAPRCCPQSSIYNILLSGSLLFHLFMTPCLHNSQLRQSLLKQDLARYSLRCSKDLSILGKRNPNIFRHKIDYHYEGSRKFLHSVINFVLLIGGRERPSRFGRSKRFDPYDGRPHFTPRTQTRLYPTLLFSTFPLLQANHDQCSPPTISMRFGNFITCCHPLGLDQCIYV